MANVTNTVHSVIPHISFCYKHLVIRKQHFNISSGIVLHTGAGIPVPSQLGFKHSMFFVIVEIFFVENANSFYVSI